MFLERLKTILEIVLMFLLPMLFVFLFFLGIAIVVVATHYYVSGLEPVFSLAFSI
jgi:hypothetical protein